jgi:hypothetical protein
MNMKTRKATDRWHLCDDGTLDTVVGCDYCEEEVRFSECERRDDGSIPNAEFRRLCEEADSDHECEEDSENGAARAAGG